MVPNFCSVAASLTSRSSKAEGPEACRNRWAVVGKRTKFQCLAIRSILCTGPRLSTVNNTVGVASENDVLQTLSIVYVYTLSVPTNECVESICLSRNEPNIFQYPLYPKDGFPSVKL